MKGVLYRALSLELQSQSISPEQFAQLSRILQLIIIKSAGDYRDILYKFIDNPKLQHTISRKLDIYVSMQDPKNVRKVSSDFRNLLILIQVSLNSMAHNV